MSIQNIGGGSASPRPVEVPVKAIETAQGPDSKQAAPSPAPTVPDSTQVKAAMEQLQKAVQHSASNLQFSVDKDTGKTIIRVTDRESGELIRQIPSQELVDIAKSIDKMQGMLLKQKA